ncbi:solute carrier family 28 member 3-like [Crassostrea virginica]
MSVELTSVSKKTEEGLGKENAAFDNGEIDKRSQDVENNSKTAATPALDEKGVVLTIEEEPAEEEEMSKCASAVLTIQTEIYDFINVHWTEIVFVFYIVLIAAYFVYFAIAMAKSFDVNSEPPVRLLVCTLLVTFLLLLKIFFRMFDSQLNELYNQSVKKRIKSADCARITEWIKLLLKIVVFLAIAIYVIVDVAIDNPQSLMSLAGLALYIIIFYCTSINPAKVNWHPVFWGIAIQYILALIILRWEFGYRMFEYLGNRTQEFLAYSDEGAIFMFGPDFRDHFFGFAVLPLIIFFYAMISVLYYLGVMQFIVRNIGQALAFLLGTSPAESLNAAGNIFVGMTESPVMIQPFLKDMTMSELHAIMVGGFATIAGSVYGAYVKFGVPANHLLSASVMSAPAALAMSKLTYPEVEKSKSTMKDFYKMGKSPHRNIIEAASAGASNSVKVVAGIAVHVIAFLSILRFINATLTWFGELVEIEELTLEFICSYVFYPIPFFMGTTPSDCRSVARLIGLKTFTNEFVAYDQLGKIINNKKVFLQYLQSSNSSGWHYNGDDLWLPNYHGNGTLKILTHGILETRSEVVATYALCGFSNFGSMGILLGALGALAPTRKSDLATIVLRAMIAGSAACFMTGCVAGLLYEDF